MSVINVPAGATKAKALAFTMGSIIGGKGEDGTSRTMNASYTAFDSENVVVRRGISEKNVEEENEVVAKISCLGSAACPVVVVALVARKDVALSSISLAKAQKV